MRMAQLAWPVHSTGCLPPAKSRRSAICRLAGWRRFRDAAAMSDDHHHHAHDAPPSDIAQRVKALESLMIEKGLVDPAALDAIVDYFEHQVGPRNGARAGARA